MSLPLKELMKLVTIAELGSVTQAAKALHIAQPALSKSVSKAEEHLGVKLFERDHAGVHVTPAGRLLLERAKCIQGELQRLEGDVDALRKGERRSVVIGVVPIHPLDQQTRAVLALMAKYPDRDFKVEVGSIDGLLNKVALGEMDFAFAPLPDGPLPFGLVEEPVYWEELVVACGRASPLYEEPDITAKVLGLQPWTIGPPGSESHARLLEFCRAHRLAFPRVPYEIEIVPARRSAVEHSDMISIFQRAQVYTPSTVQNLRALDVRWPHARRAIGTVRPVASPTGIHDYFVSMIRSVFDKDGLTTI
jgi:DNA-binding transcriptional LysR family regulator